MKKNLSILLAVVMVMVSIPMMTFTGVSAAGNYDYGDALLKSVWFYDANKCGPDVALDNVFKSWRSACHTADTATDGTDVSGGFHDAGDHVKFGLPQAFAASNLGWALYEYRADMDKAGVTTKLLSTLKYFTDYFLRCYPNKTTFYYEVGDGGVDHGYWGPPELQTGSRKVWVATPTAPASDMCGQTSAALSLMYLNYKSTDSAYANKCLQAAKDMYDFGKTYLGRGFGGDFYKSSSHFDDLSWAAIWLAVATGDMEYLAPVDAWLDIKNDPGDDNYKKPWTHCWDDSTLGILTMMTSLTNNEKYLKGLLWNLTWYRDTLTKTPAGLPYLNNWAVLRYDSAEAGIAYMAYKKFGNTDYLKMADFMIDYALGSNPLGLSYLTNFGSKSVQHPHHRANEPKRDGVTNGIIGALAGGPSSGDSFVDDVGQYVYTEVALDYNASFILGCAGRLYTANGGPGGKPIPTPTPPPTCPPGNGDGLSANFYKGIALSGDPILSRIDPKIDFNWAGGAPDTTVPSDGYSVRWSGQIEARSTEPYTFYLSSDDGSRLLIDGKVVIEDWTGHAAKENTAKVNLVMGQKYNITVEYYEDWGDASCQLSWSSTAVPKEIIPKSQLYSSNAPAVSPSPTVTLPASPTPTPTVTQPSVSPYDYEFKVDTNFEPAYLVANQMITAKVVATNVSAEAYTGKKDVLLIVALYDSKNTMVNVSYISKGITYQGTETLSAGFKLPSSTIGYSVKAFVWDGQDLQTTNMIPLSNVTSAYGPVPAS